MFILTTGSLRPGFAAFISAPEGTRSAGSGVFVPASLIVLWREVRSCAEIARAARGVRKFLGIRRDPKLLSFFLNGRTTFSHMSQKSKRGNERGKLLISRCNHQGHQRLYGLNGWRRSAFKILYALRFLFFRFDAFALLKKDRKSGYKENVHVAVVSRQVTVSRAFHRLRMFQEFWKRAGILLFAGRACDLSQEVYGD